MILAMRLRDISVVGSLVLKALCGILSFATRSWFSRDALTIDPPLYGHAGVKEFDTGLAHRAFWDLNADQQAMKEEQPLQVWPKRYDGDLWHRYTEDGF
jgi:hypothetical protein